MKKICLSIPLGFGPIKKVRYGAMAIFILLRWQILPFARFEKFTNSYLKTPLFRTLCRCIDLVSMRIASLTLWQTRFSRKSHHVRFFYFFKTLFILYHFISSHFFRKCKPAFQKLFYLTIVKNRESLII